MTTEQAYRALGLAPPASADEVKRAYRRKALESHPDRFQDERDKAFYAKRFLEIREAYAQLREGSVPDLPEESVVVPEFKDNLAGRSFAPKEGEAEDVSASDKLGLQMPFKVDALVAWGLGLPAAAVALVYFLRKLLEALKGGAP